MIVQGSQAQAPLPDDDDLRADSLRAAYRGLRAIGWTETEAANLSAHLAGLDPVRHGWRLPEIERLLFIRSLVDSGRIVR